MLNSKMIMLLILIKESWKDSYANAYPRLSIWYLVKVSLHLTTLLFNYKTLQFKIQLEGQLLLAVKSMTSQWVFTSYSLANEKKPLKLEAFYQ